MMESLLPPDHAVRTQALDPMRSYIVQAPAGSGKTELLTMRFLQLLGEVDKPEEILAITFTRAATAEMRRRILESLEKAADLTNESGEMPVILARRALLRSQEQGWDLLNNPHLLKIETIDSFSMAIANRTPLLAGLGGRLHPVESAESYYSLAAQRTLQQLGGEEEQLSDAIAALLSLRDNRVVDCQELIAAMLASRDRWQHAYVLSQHVDWQQVRMELEKPFLRAIRSTLKRLETMLASSGVNGEEVVKLVSFACGNLAQPDCEGYAPHLEKIKALGAYPGFPAATEDHLAAWRCLAPFLLVDKDKWRSSINKRHGFPQGSTHEQGIFATIVSRLERIPGLRETLNEVACLPPAHYSEEQWALLAKLFLTLRRAKAELDVIFAERGVVDFAELGLAAENVLKYPDEILGDIPSDLALAKGDQLRHILVDEFQDTSRRQHSLLRKLTAGWLPLEGRTCFLVGDPMQSIYLFRQAEVELFQNAGRHGLTPDLPLQSLRLTTNFRSNRGVVEPLNTILASVFERNGGAASAPVEFSPSVASDPAFYPHNVNVFADFILSEQPDAAREAQRREARAIVSIVESHRDRLAMAARENSEYRIAILGRARNHLFLVAEELRQQNIPFRAVELESLDERQEIIDLTALLRALLHPMDRVAWLAVLRAPWCGLTLADLHQLCGSDSREFIYTSVPELLQTRLALLSEDGQKRAGATRLVLQQAMSQRLHYSTSQPLAPWLERTWHSLRGPQCIDETASQNVQAFFNMLDQLDAEGIAYPGRELDDRLKRLFAQPDPRTSDRHGVQLMTIHKAKGLGFEVVIVPALERPGKVDDAKLLTWLERSIPSVDADDADESEILVAPIGGKGEDRNALNRWVTRQETIRLAEEQKRLFYVACTRARHELHLLGTATIGSHFDKKSQSVQYKLKEPRYGSLLRTAWPGLEADFHKSLERWKHEQNSKVTQPPALGVSHFHSDDTQQTFAFAAPAEKSLRRLPDVRSLRPILLSVTTSDTLSGLVDSGGLLQRPSGSLSARAFGIAVHTLLDRAARLLMEEPDYRLVQQSLSRWIVATAHLLRQQGIPNTQARSLANDVIATIRDVLDDETGRWILSPHPEAASEAAWSGSSNGVLRNLRADRVFRAGVNPSDTGDDIYWIVDFKTASHGPSGLEDFLADEKRQYSAQLEAYAEALRMLKGPTIRIKLALYYPVLRRLVDWLAE